MLGVLFGLFLGGFVNWRVVFGFMIVLVIIIMLGMIKFVLNVFLSVEVNISKELIVFKNLYILIVIVIIVFGYFGVFIIYIFMELMI